VMRPKRSDREVQARHWLVPVWAYSHSSTRVLNPLYLLLLGLLFLLKFAIILRGSLLILLILRPEIVHV